MGKEMKITVVRDGPYLVTGGVPLAEELIDCDDSGTPVKWEPGRRFPDRQSYSLCRCGQSSDKPFCDNSHLEAGFRDSVPVKLPEPYFDDADVIEGPAVDLFDVTRLCVRAGFCHRGGNVWQLAATASDQDTLATVIADAVDCPSGRLVASRRRSGERIEPSHEPAISLIQIPSGKASGPLWVKGGIPIESIDGRLFEVRNRVTLCRCGASRNMPFCDASHTRIGFNDGSPSVR